MRALVLLARSHDTRFRIYRRYDLDLLYREEAGNAYLILPSASGLRSLVMQEVHAAPTGGHFGAAKMISLLL